MKKLLYLSVLLGGLCTTAYAEKLAIVIDDSAGMCGYLDAPTEKNAYKKALQVLLRARDASSLDVQAYYLSNLNQPLPVGAALDKIIAATAKNCPFTATTSPLQQGLDLQKLKSDAVLMVTDLLFDEGGAGSSDSRAAFINQFDQFANSRTNAAQWFNSSAGILGLKSNFKGNYYTIQGQGKTDFSAQAIERPFYWVWMSKTPKFFPYLNQLTHVWASPNWANKKLTLEGVYALRLLPVTELVAVKQGLFAKPVVNSLQEKNLSVPSIHYGNNQNKKLMDALQPVDNTGKYPIVAECFKASSNPLVINFNGSCASGGGNVSALYEHKQLPSSIILSYPLNNIERTLERTFNVNVVEGGFNNSVEAFYRTSLQSEALKQHQNKYPASLVVHVANLKSNRSLLLNSPTVKTKKLAFLVQENYRAKPSTGIPVSAAKQHWSAAQEPCMTESAECKKANASTYQFDSLIGSLNTKLNANQRAATLLNKSSVPSEISIVLDANK